MSERGGKSLGKELTRKEFVAGSAAVGLGLVLAACSGDDKSTTSAKPKSETAPLKDGLAEGMYGGPTGFEGAERYQYPLDSEEGRAIFALRRLRQDGAAPDTLRVVHRFPEGGGIFMREITVSEMLAGRRTGVAIYELAETAVAPGRTVDGALVRRPSAGGSFAYGVNAFADTDRHESTYLFLQWLGGARVNSWVSLLPGFVGPLHVYALEDPLLADSYGAQTIQALNEATHRSAPGIEVPGGWSYYGALNGQLSGVLLDEQTAEEAMNNTAEEWNRITEDLGLESQIEAFANTTAAWPNVVDPLP